MKHRRTKGREHDQTTFLDSNNMRCSIHRYTYTCITFTEVSGKTGREIGAVEYVGNKKGIQVRVDGICSGEVKEIMALNRKRKYL